MKSVLGVWCTDKHHLTEIDKEYRESNHESKKDPVTHITAVVSDKSATKAQSIHLPLPKK
jgi:hypothetical protein